MDSQTIIALQIFANSIITIVALGLYYIAYQSWKRHKQAELESSAAVFRTLFGQQFKVRKPAPYSQEEHSDWLREMAHQDELIPFGDWLAKRREAANES